MTSQELQTLLHPHLGNREALIPILQQVQEKEGYVPESLIPQIAQALGLSPSQVQGVVTFYSQFYTAPRGRNVVKVCRGTACHVRGGRGILRVVQKNLNLEDGQTAPDYSFTLETVACLGACALSPVMVVNKSYYGKMTPKRVETILDKYQKAGQNE
jgi:NADH-quinone oxidoreductase E subunit